MFKDRLGRVRNLPLDDSPLMMELGLDCQRLFSNISNRSNFQIAYIWIVLRHVICVFVGHPVIMKQRLPLIFILIALPLTFFAQGGFGLPPGFDLKQFQKNEEQALWFIQYDSMIIRVQTFDRGMMGKDFVCYQDKKGWKVVAGTIDSAGIKGTRWFQVDAKNTVSEMKKKGDTVLVASMARALYNGDIQLKKLKLESSAVWKKYARVNADLTITVSMFCDQDASGVIWYGPECNWWFSSDGTALVTTKVINKAPLQAVISGTTINLSCPTEKMPTVGTMWLAYRVMQKYPQVNVAYKTGTSTLSYNATFGTYSWQHAAN